MEAVCYSEAWQPAINSHFTTQKTAIGFFFAMRTIDLNAAEIN
jgi:hypothetical protein